MKKSTFLFLTIFTLVITISSCGKYEDGPKISLASKKSRVANKWKTESRFRNGAPEQIPSDEINNTLELTKDGKVYAFNAKLAITFTGTWEFSSDKEDILATVMMFGTTKFYTFKILRLKHDELWVESTDDKGDLIEEHLKPV